MATKLIKNCLTILISFSFCGIIYYLFKTSAKERYQKSSLRMILLNSDLGVKGYGDKNVSMEYTTEATFTHPKHEPRSRKYRQLNLGMIMLNSSLDLKEDGDVNISLEYSTEAIFTHPMSTFKQFGLEQIDFLKRMESKRPLFNITMEPWKILQTKHRMDSTDCRWPMIIAVKTAYYRVEQRQRVRKTWGFNKFFNGVCLDVVFVVASTSTAESNVKLGKEESEHGDILQIELEETYRNIGLKALASMQWVADNFPSNWIYSSGDDDMLPDFPCLFKNIEKSIPEEGKFSTNSSNSILNHRLNTKNFPIFCGHGYRPTSKPHRFESKWHVSVEKYPYDYYPPFCLGGFYSMSVKHASAIYSVSRWYPYFDLDDVWITGFMRLRLCDVMTDRDFVFNKRDIHCGISSMNEVAVKHDI
uniref:beta-1,3-galactosyltransferase brn-like n=1 Tax=Styela clava TaxID=7725 RepID=UPI001939A933|nr:beta-1,3-galactosyltransferase brn-like [Styela clava]